MEIKHLQALYCLPSPCMSWFLSNLCLVNGVSGVIFHPLKIPTISHSFSFIHQTFKSNSPLSLLDFQMSQVHYVLAFSPDCSSDYELQMQSDIVLINHIRSNNRKDIGIKSDRVHVPLTQTLLNEYRELYYIPNSIQMRLPRPGGKS